MVFTNLLVANSSNSYQLAFFICQLFIGGRFRTGHIFFDPNTIDGALISEIDKVCPQSILWLTTDVTREIASLWIADNSTDRILQLIFFDPNRLSRDVTRLKSLFVYYKLFIMQLIGVTEVMDRRFVIKILGPIAHGSPILNYEPGNDSMSLQVYIGSWATATIHRRLSTFQIAH